jgi:hypothetical protein
MRLYPGGVGSHSEHAQNPVPLSFPFGMIRNNCIDGLRRHPAFSTFDPFHESRVEFDLPPPFLTPFGGYRSGYFQLRFTENV